MCNSFPPPHAANALEGHDALCPLDSIFREWAFSLYKTQGSTARRAKSRKHSWPHCQMMLLNHSWLSTLCWSTATPYLWFCLISSLGGLWLSVGTLHKLIDMYYGKSFYFLLRNGDPSLRVVLSCSDSSEDRSDACGLWDACCRSRWEANNQFQVTHRLGSSSNVP